MQNSAPVSEVVAPTKVASLSIVVPCYNEDQVLPETSARLLQLIERMAVAGLVREDSSVYFVDDGSRDRTWEIITSLNATRPDRFHGIKLSRNRGHQNALVAGLRTVPGDVAISIDADLQDDIDAIPEMIEKFYDGKEVVYGVRAAREKDTYFKRTSARFYYSILKRLGVEIVADHADFRLLSRRALDALGRYNEVNLFLRAIVPLLGFETDQVLYHRNARFAGETKYPLRKMLALAIDGVTSFSMRPLRLITGIGCVIASISFFVGIWAIAVVIFSDLAVPGWASIVVPTAFLGGLQLFSIGIIGEYIGKIYLEAKHRPLFEIEKII